MINTSMAAADSGSLHSLAALFNVWAVGVRVCAAVFCPGKRVVVLESRLLGSGQTGRAVGDMTTWHTGLFSSLERYTSTEQRKQVSIQGTALSYCAC